MKMAATAKVLGVRILIGKTRAATTSRGRRTFQKRHQFRPSYKGPRHNTIVGRTFIL